MDFHGLSLISMDFMNFHEFSWMFMDFYCFSLIFINFPSPGAWRSGGLWRAVRAVAACGTGVVALLEDCIMEAWSPGGLEPGDLEARMMRLRMRMLMNEERDED